MLSWGNHGYPSHDKAKPLFFQSVGKSGDCEVKRLFRVEYLHAEGQEVSAEHRFRLFVGCGGKGKDAGKHVHTPKGRRFQENIDSVCSERPTQAKKTCSLSLVSMSAQNTFFFLLASR